MELLNMYQKCIMHIDEIKEEELQKGLTTKCKQAINEAYSKISGKEGELELELYKRKSCLLNDVKVTSNLKYDMFMSSVGAFLGAVVGYFLQETIQLFIGLRRSIKEGLFFQLSPLEIIYGDSAVGEGVIFFIIIAVTLVVLYKKQDIKKNDDLFVFQLDMGNYEIQKIDELLEKL